MFGLAKNVRLVRTIGAELQEAKAESLETQRPARRFKELVYRKRKSWVPPAARGCQGRADRGQSQPALHRHLIINQ